MSARKTSRLELPPFWPGFGRTPGRAAGPVDARGLAREAGVDPLWAELTSPERLPGLSAAGMAMLWRLRAHPAAPIYRNFSGHRLPPAAQWWARLRGQWLLSGGIACVREPLWLRPWMLSQVGEVLRWPSARQCLGPWADIPTAQRADLADHLATWIPRRRMNRQLLCFSTSGSTGHPIRVPTHALAAASYQFLHERALRLHGVRMRAGRGDVGVVLAGFQQRCFSYVSVNPLRGECGLAKLNLHPQEWRHPDDRARYLDALRPELISGDPVSLSELARLPLQHAPKALLSTSMALSAGLRTELEQRFGAPVVDLYSMNEAGPIAAYVCSVDAFVLLQPGLFVEVLDAQGRALPAGEVGEVTITGGINACLPLLRYRTGDQAALVMTALGPALRNLQGRAPVRFRHAQGHWVNNIEISQVLRSFPLRRFTLHQGTDARLRLRVDAHCGAGHSHETALGLMRPRLDAAIAQVLGPVPLEVQALLADDKARQYTSALAGALAQAVSS
jgi:phenylacetate-CoA ligase